MKLPLGTLRPAAEPLPEADGNRSARNTRGACSAVLHVHRLLRQGFLLGAAWAEANLRFPPLYEDGVLRARTLGASDVALTRTENEGQWGTGTPGRKAGDGLGGGVRLLRLAPRWSAHVRGGRRTVRREPAHRR